ncbi:MAG: hypothetical protein E7075_10060 [Bacteroidales bacterium]|nr:hypothetical protein [Bacteroidales bacterium]
MKRCFLLTLLALLFVPTATYAAPLPGSFVGVIVHWLQQPTFWGFVVIAVGVGLWLILKDR